MRALLAVLVLGVLALGVYPYLCPPTTASADPYARYLAPAAACPNATLPTATSAQQVQAITCLIEYARHVHGLTALAPSSALDQVAQAKLADLARCSHFSHDPCGHGFPSYYQAVGYGRGYAFVDVGENLYYGTGVLRTARATVDGWLNSREHREALFTPGWKQVGVAVLPVASFLGHPHALLAAAEFGVDGD